MSPIHNAILIWFLQATAAGIGYATAGFAGLFLSNFTEYAPFTFWHFLRLAVSIVINHRQLVWRSKTSTLIRDVCLMGVVQACALLTSSETLR